MREKRTAQTSLFDPPAIDHPLADGLERASVWLDEHPELLDVGVPATQALPRRYRSGYLLPETLLRSRPVPLARLAAIPGLRALGRVRPQPDAPRATAPCGRPDAFRQPSPCTGSKTGERPCPMPENRRFARPNARPR